MEFEKLQDIIADVLNVQKEEIKPETTFVMTSVQILSIFSRSLWGLKRSLISRSTMMRQRRS